MAATGTREARAAEGGAIALNSSSGESLRLESLSFAYRGGSGLALDDVTAVFESRSIAVLGPNGAGKSTLFRVLSTLEKPRSGTFRVGDLSPDRWVDREIYRRRLGVLPQQFRIFGAYSCAEFLRYVCWLRRVPPGETEAAVEEALTVVQLEDHADQPVKRLSGGMRQRLGLAQAVVSRPALVLLDEPTVGLDPRQRMEFRHYLTRLSQTCTLVVATHLVEDVAAVADEVLVLCEGSPLYAGTLYDMCRGGNGEGISGADVERAYLRLVPAGEAG